MCVAAVGVAVVAVSLELLLAFVAWLLVVVLSTVWLWLTVNLWQLQHALPRSMQLPWYHVQQHKLHRADCAFPQQHDLWRTDGVVMHRA